MSRTTTPLVAVLGLISLINFVQAADKTKESPVALERKLNGAWQCNAPCAGKITFWADGTFERRGYSPGGNTLRGTWEIRWNALPPTLVLACKASDDPTLAGTTEQSKLIELNDEAFSVRYSRHESLYRYVRANKADKSAKD